MTAPLFILILLTAIVVVYAGIAVTTWLQVRGTRLVECPENHQLAAVEVDAAHAAVGAIREQPDLRLNACSRWPDRLQCNQACVQQIAISPQETRASSVLKRFFDGQVCALCHRAIPAVHLGDQKPGVLNVVTGRMLAWEEIPAQDPAAIFHSHVPICSNCQIVETFRRQHPDLIVDRHRAVEVQGRT